VVQADGKFIIPGLWDSQLNFCLLRRICG